MTDILKLRKHSKSKRFVKYKYLQNTTPKTILMGAPNGGKCPNCLTGRLSFLRYGARGEEYYSCVKCGFVVKK